MIHRALFVLMFAFLGALIYGWWYNSHRIGALQRERMDEKMEVFMRKGARFTASDGQTLCLRIQRLEMTSYGFLAQGFVPEPCEYGQSK